MDGESQSAAEPASFFSQSEFDLRFEWGANGVAALAAICDAIVIVDVLSFSTCVDIAASNGAFVYPYRWKDASAAKYAVSVGAILASFERGATAQYSLSPTSLLALPGGSRIVLPSPNGSALSVATGDTPTYAGCLRNASAVANYLLTRTSACKIGVIAAGEKWEDDGLRPALEDLVGAGAVLSRLKGARSPEAELAIAAFEQFRESLPQMLRTCGSGKELIGRGFPRDVELAAEQDASRAVPRLIDGCYQNVA